MQLRTPEEMVKALNWQDMSCEGLAMMAFTSVLLEIATKKERKRLLERTEKIIQKWDGDSPVIQLDPSRTSKELQQVKRRVAELLKLMVQSLRAQQD